MSFQYKIRGEQFVQFERQSQDYIEQRDQDLESSLSYDFSNLNADNLTSGTVPSARIAGSYTGITDVGTLTTLNVTGTATASLNIMSELRATGGNFLIINSGDSYVFATGQTSEFLYVNAESGLQVNSSPDNWASGWAGRNTATICAANGTSSFPSTVTATLFSGSGASLTSIPAGQLTGTVANARISGSYSNFTNITASGAIVGNAFAGDGSFITALNAAQLTGTVASARISGAYNGITDIGTLSSGLSVTTNISATGDITLTTAGQEFVAKSPTTGSGNAAHWVLVGSQYRLYRNTSTIREKENIQSVGNLLNPNMIDAINVQLWNRKTAPGIPEVGPIAEEMDAISPFLSTRGLEWDDDGAPIPSPVDGINSNTWLSLLTIGMQDIRQRLQQLETA